LKLGTAAVRILILPNKFLANFLSVILAAARQFSKRNRPPRRLWGIETTTITTMIKLYLLAKKIHRFLVLIIIAMMAIIVWTGVMMKYSWAPFGTNLAKARYIHNQLSVVFTIVLALMAITGIAMYLLPFLIKRKEVSERQRLP
jgi:hypothetical protein